MKQNQIQNTVSYNLSVMPNTITSYWKKKVLLSLSPISSIKMVDDLWLLIYLRDINDLKLSSMIIILLFYDYCLMINDWLV